jgi:molybdenum cofactor cytidylyltransferase
MADRCITAGSDAPSFPVDTARVAAPGNAATRSASRDHNVGPCRGRIVGIVLAAGSSTRLGRPKQVLDLAGKPVICHVVERSLAAGLDEVIVVTGGAGMAVTSVLAGYPVRIVPNPAYLAGQSTSLVTGLRAVMDDASVDAIVVLLGDQPGVDPEDIVAVAARRRLDSPPVVMTAYGDTRSHPILFGHEVFPELLAITGDQGGRDVIRAHAPEVAVVRSGQLQPPLDLDTEDAYQTLLATWPERRHPT